MTYHPGIDPSAREVAANARLLKVASITLLATGLMLLIAGGLALYYLGIQGLGFMPFILLVALVEIAAGLFFRRRARAMMDGLTAVGD